MLMIGDKIQGNMVVDYDKSVISQSDCTTQVSSTIGGASSFAGS